MPITLRIVFVVAATVAAALAARFVLGRVIRTAHVASARDTADLVMQAAAALYGVLVAFILAGSWERFDDGRVTIILEASVLADLQQIAQLLPTPLSTELAGDVLAYQQHAPTFTTPSAQRKENARTSEILDHMWRDLARFQPLTQTHTTLQALAFERLRQLGEHQRIISESDHRLPAIVWIILIGGAAVILILVAIEGRDPLSALYLALLAAIISLALFAIYALSYPVRSGLIAP